MTLANFTALICDYISLLGEADANPYATPESTVNQFDFLVLYSQCPIN
jgi:hypothetical protein